MDQERRNPRSKHPGGTGTHRPPPQFEGPSLPLTAGPRRLLDVILQRRTAQSFPVQGGRVGPGIPVGPLPPGQLSAPSGPGEPMSLVTATTQFLELRVVNRLLPGSPRLQSEGSVAAPAVFLGFSQTRTELAVLSLSTL